jgi:hypothetical protein
MGQKYGRDELVARMIRAGELEVSGEHQDELADYFAVEYSFHGPGGFESDFAGLAAYFQSLRDAFDDRTIRRGIILVEGNTIACQTWIEGTFRSPPAGGSHRAAERTRGDARSTQRLPSSRNTRPAPARPWPSVESRRCTPTVPAAGCRPLCVRGHREPHRP